MLAQSPTAALQFMTGHMAKSWVTKKRNMEKLTEDERKRWFSHGNQHTKRAEEECDEQEQEE